MKLNKKGFTLVELLAVIIILAIVVGITIPAVLTTISNTRLKAFQTATESVADWIEREYQAYQVGDSSISVVSSAFTTANCQSGTCTVSDGLLTAAGVKPANFTVDGSSITINTTTGRACVKLKGSSDGEYQSDAVKQSAAC